jgi:NAD(P)H-flavin reductase
MTLQKLPAQMVGNTDLSHTAKEITLRLAKPLPFKPGAFFNVFMERDGERKRRAYSISSHYGTQDEVKLSIRKGSKGGMSEAFWEPGIQDAAFEVMGPLGLNTADKIRHSRVFLIGFGIGVSVVKSVLHYLLDHDEAKEIWVITGNRSEEEVLYKEFFERIDDPRVRTRFVLSRPHDSQYPFRGYIPEHVGDLDFSDSTVYICGQKKAAEALKETILASGARDVQFLIEAFD